MNKIFVAYIFINTRIVNNMAFDETGIRFVIIFLVFESVVRVRCVCSFILGVHKSPSWHCPSFKTIMIKINSFSKGLWHINVWVGFTWFTYLKCALKANPCHDRLQINPIHFCLEGSIPHIPWRVLYMYIPIYLM